MNSTITNRSRTTTNSAILTEAGTALAANRARVSGRIQNLSANALFVKYGAGASTTSFTVILPAATGADDGTSKPHELGSYTGIVTVAGTTPRCVASEDLM
jgi:hypothetical protein